MEIPNTFQVFRNTERDKGIRVTANSSIFVYGMNFKTVSTDAFLALPCAHLPVENYEYFGVSYYGIESDNALNHFVIVGSEDNTSVQIGSNPELTLHTMETYLWEDTDSFTGTRIISNKPLAVFVGARCTFVPKGTGNCDHLYEQIPPTAAWGTNFLTASLATRTSEDLYRVLASQNSSSVTVNCTTFRETTTYDLHMPGFWREINTTSDSFCSI